MFKPKIKFIKNNKFLSFFLKSSVRAITLAPFGIYFRDKRTVRSKRTMNHEKIHWKQQLELLIIFFYVLYFLEWIFKIFFTSNAYRNLSFEREAYKFDDDFEYLKNRKHYAWIKYIFTKP